MRAIVRLNQARLCTAIAILVWAWVTPVALADSIGCTTAGKGAHSKGNHEFYDRFITLDSILEDSFHLVPIYDDKHHISRVDVQREMLYADIHLLVMNFDRRRGWMWPGEHSREDWRDRRDWDCERHDRHHHHDISSCGNWHDKSNSNSGNSGTGTSASSSSTSNPENGESGTSVSNSFASNSGNGAGTSASNLSPSNSANGGTGIPASNSSTSNSENGESGTSVSNPFGSNLGNGTGTSGSNPFTGSSGNGGVTDIGSVLSTAGQPVPPNQGVGTDQNLTNGAGISSSNTPPTFGTSPNSGSGTNSSHEVVATPESSTLWFLGTALLGLIGAAKLRVLLQLTT
jgi:hypothetical protein